MRRMLVVCLGLAAALVGCAGAKDEPAPVAGKTQVQTEGAAGAADAAPAEQMAPVPSEAAGEEAGSEPATLARPQEPSAAAEGPSATTTAAAAPVATDMSVPEASASQTGTPQASQGQVTYSVRVVDQDGNPVPDVVLLFSLDAQGTEVRCSGAGTAVFEGEGQVYHVQVIDAPLEYTWSQESEAYTEAWGGEVTIRVERG